MRWPLVRMMAMILPLSSWGCDCLEKGRNGVPDPQSDEFQLMFNNIVSNESDIYVDGVNVGAVCRETEFCTVGNFPVSPRTELKIHLLMHDTHCIISPNCSSNCGAQECVGQPLIDTTPFAGKVYNTGLIWRQ